MAAARTPKVALGVAAAGCAWWATSSSVGSDAESDVLESTINAGKRLSRSVTEDLRAKAEASHREGAAQEAIAAAVGRSSTLKRRSSWEAKFTGQEQK